MRTTRRAVCLVVCCVLAAPAFALNPDRPVTSYMVDFWHEASGLPQKFVMAIRQTSDGYLWVATKGGLGRFDGVRFKTYSDLRPGQFLEAEVWDVAEGADGSIWVAVNGGGLSHLKDGRVTTYTVEQGLPSNNLTSLARDAEGALWFGTTRGLGRLQEDRFTSFTMANGLPSDGIYAVHADQDGTLWIGTDRGLAAYEGGRFVNYASKHPGVLDSAVGDIAGSRSEGLWLGTSIGGARGRGLRRLKDGTARAWTAQDGLPSDSVTALLVDGPATVWIGTDAGLCRFRNGRFETLLTEVTSIGTQRTLETASLRAVQSLQLDREGSLWVGTGTDGLARLRDVAFTTVAGGDAVGPDVYVVYEARDGAVWLGSLIGVARLVDGTVKGYSLAGGVRAMAEESDGGILLGSTGGIYRWRTGTISRMALGALDSMTMSALAVDPRGVLWIGTRENGLYSYSNGAITRFGAEQGLLGAQVRALALDRQGRLFIGTRDGGLNVFEAGRFHHYGEAEGLASATAQAVCVLDDGTAWVATKRGLSRVRDGAIANVTAQQGLPANYFYQLVADGDRHLWLTYGRGIARVPLTELDDVADGKASSVSPVLLGSESGLQSTAMPVGVQPAAFRGRDGRLWFATSRGAAVSDPRALGRNLVPPTVHVEELVVDKREVEDLKDGIALPPSQGDIAIRYTGLSYLSPDRVNFKYILEPFERGWTEAESRRVAYYPQLGPGTYRFRVVAFNADGVQSDREASLSFRLEPHWNQTKVFKGLIGFVVVALVVGGYRWRLRAVRARERELEQRVDERTQELQREIGVRREAEEQLQAQMMEREQAEEEARQFAARLATSNDELQENQAKLERENSERRRAEETAGRERDLLHGLMDNIPDLIYFKDGDSRYTRINKSHAAALGLPGPDAATGRTDFDFFPQEFARTARESEAHLLLTGEPIVGQVEHDASRGRWYLATKVPLRDASGRLSGLVGISKDITERKLAEENLERQLRAFLQVVDAAVDGDLTRRGQEGSDTLGRIARSVNRMFDSFARILSGVRDTALSVSSAAAEILAAATQIAKGAEHGSDETQSTSAAVGQMAASMVEVSRNAEQSAEVAREVMSHVGEGEASVGATALGIARIDSAVGETASRMRELDGRSRQIFEIVGILEEIATQSTLLSLNAAIEAAHSGDAGRGFGVVAEEMRRLADRSAASTKEVSAIVEGIVEETRLVVVAMEQGLREVESGRALSERAQHSLRTIQDLVERSAQFAQEISFASREQAQVTRSVSDAMQSIANVTQESAIGAHETQRAVRDLVALAAELTRSIDHFQTGAIRQEG